MKFFSLLTLSTLILSTSVFAKGKPGGSTTNCNSVTGDKAFSISSVSLESSRRIKVVSNPGRWGGVDRDAYKITLKSTAGTQVIYPTSAANFDVNNQLIENLKPGVAYEISVSGVLTCPSASPVVRITMPANAPETNAPVITAAEMLYPLMGTGSIRIFSSDDTAIAGVKIWLDGVLIRDEVVSGLRSWQSFAHPLAPFPLEGAGSYFGVATWDLQGLMRDVRVEVRDIYGNVSSQDFALRI